MIGHDAARTYKAARTIRGMRSEAPVGPEHGLPEAGVISCDNVITAPIIDVDEQRVGHLDETAAARLDQALRYTLHIVY